MKRQKEREESEESSEQSVKEGRKQLQAIMVEQSKGGLKIALVETR